MIKKEFDIIVIGAGAAGLMAALTAGRNGARVALLEHGSHAGAKILISGGGRCNFTHLQTRPENFVTANRHFARSALARYTPAMFVEMVDRHNIAWHEKTEGQLFCDGSARQIVDMLTSECAAANVTPFMNCVVHDISRGDVFSLQTSSGAMVAKAVIIATGGLSIPKLGATGFAYQIARDFEVPVVQVAPALVPFTFATDDDISFPTDLAGVSLRVTVSCNKASFTDSMLITHRGVSGPAMLQISSYWQTDTDVVVDLLPSRNIANELLALKKNRPRIEAQTALAQLFPQRLAVHLAGRFLPEGTIANIPDRVITALATKLSQWPMRPNGTEGYAKAEVTRGGIDTRALSSKTMEVSAVPGLYFVGEAVDVTGWLGGYNFQWAWASGNAAGHAAAAACLQ